MALRARLFLAIKSSLNFLKKIIESIFHQSLRETDKYVGYYIYHINRPSFFVNDVHIYHIIYARNFNNLSVYSIFGKHHRLYEENKSI